MLQRSTINRQLRSVQQLLELVWEADPGLLGSAVSGVDSVYTAWRRFVLSRRRGGDARSGHGVCVCVCVCMCVVMRVCVLCVCVRVICILPAGVGSFLCHSCESNP